MSVNRIMSLLRRLLPTDRFVRRVSVLVGGTAGAQIIMVLAAPVLTRFYSPADFGLLAVFVSLLSLVTVVAALRYEQAIPLPDDDNEAAALLVISLLAASIVTGFSAVPVFFYRSEIARLLNVPALADYLFLVPLGALFAAVYSMLNNWALRMKAFTPIAKTKVSQAVVTVAIQIGAAPLGPGALLAGQVAGQTAGSLSLFMRVLRPHWHLIRNVKWGDIVLVGRRYIKFPIFSTWSAVFNTAGSQLPSLLFAFLFSPAAAGIYILANRVLSMPMQFLGQAIAHVFYSGAAQAHRDGNLGALVGRVHRRLAHIGMPPILILLIAGPDVFGQVFGAQWRESGLFAQWLAPWLYLVFITSPLTSVVLVLERQGAGMAFQALLLLVRVAAIAAGAWMDDLTTAVALFAIGSAGCWLFYLVWVMRAAGNRALDLCRSTLSALVWGIALVSPVLVGTMWRMDQTLWLFSVAAASVLITSRYAYLMKNAWI